MRLMEQINSTYHRTHETYSPVGSRKRRMRESGVQSTGAEIKKYLTVDDCQFQSNRKATFKRRDSVTMTYGCRLAAKPLARLEANFAVLRSRA